MRPTVVLLACMVLVACRDGGTRESTAVERSSSFEIGSPAAPYRLVYRLDDVSDPDVAPTTDEVWVRPPFESRLETSSGTTVTGVQISAIDRLRLGTVDQPLVIARVPGLAVSDVRVRSMLDDGVAAGLLDAGEQRTIRGRRCQVIRSGTLLGAGPLVPITDAEHADSCVDADGLVLEETLFTNGTPTLHRIATEVDLSPALEDDLFDAGDIVVPVDRGAGSSRRVDPAHGALGPFWELRPRDLPAGFHLVGRFSVIPPQSDRFAIPQNPAVIAGTADVFARGADMFVIYQGGTAGGVQAFPPAPLATPIDGGALGHGEAVLSALGNELHFPQRRGKFVHVIGTMTVDALTHVARQLVLTQGTGLVYLDG